MASELKEYLDFEEVSAEDAAVKRRYLAMCQDWSSLEEHDKKYHPGGYKEGDACKVREELEKGDASERALAEAVSGGKGGSESILGNIRGLAEEYEDLQKNLHRKINLPYEDYRREKEKVAQSRERFFDALKGTPWSAFGDDADNRFNRLADFSKTLPDGANMNLLLDYAVDLSSDEANSLYDPEEAYDAFSDSYGEEDETVGDTLKKAVPVIESIFNERAEDERAERQADDDAWGEEEARRDAIRYNAPLSAYLEGV